MAFNLGLTTSRDTYTYFSCPGASFVLVNVFNANVDVGVGRMVGQQGAEAATYDAVDIFCAPGSTPVFNADAIRFKSHVRGTPGQIAINARPKSELPEGVPLAASYTPNYLTVNPDGTISADFSGHISARGIDLQPAPSDSGVSGDNRLNWIKDGNSQYDGLIYVSNLDGVDGINSRRRMQLGTWPNSPIGGSTPTSGLDIIDWPTRAVNSVTAFTRNQFRTILDDNQQSRFLQLVDDARLMVQYTQRSAAVPAGASTTFLNLPLGFPASHLAFLAWVRVAAGASTTVFRSAPNTTSQGFIDINSTIAQNVTFDILAIGT